MRDDTMIFVTGDNGTTDRVILPPWKPTRGKGSVYQEGIWVPLIVSGPLVTRPGSQSDVLVDGTDFFATFAEIARIPLSTALPPGTVLDSVSFLPSIVDPALASGRSYSLAEHFQPNGRGEGHPKPTPPLPHYQPELMQYQGPGTTHLAVGTEYLDLGNRADAFLTLAPPNAYVELYVWEQQAATSKFGGTLASSGAPSRTLTGFTDSSGALSWVDALVVDMEDFQQPHSWYVQSRIDDPSQAGGYQLSNAVNVRFNEASNIKAIRNQCWALVVSMNGNPQHEELYDLCTDPFQQIDYLKSGPLTPGTKEHANYVALRAKLTSWLE